MADDLGRGQELDGPALICRRPLGQEKRGVRRQLVGGAALGHEADDRQVIAEYAYPALRRLALRRYRGNSGRAAADGGEEIEIDRGAQRGGALVGLRGIKEQLGGRRCVGGHSRAL